MTPIRIPPRASRHLRSAVRPSPPPELGLRSLLFHAPGLPLALPQIVELGPAHTGLLDDLDLLDGLRVQREYPFHPLPEGDLADGHGGAGSAAPKADHHPLEDLDPLPLRLLGLALYLLLHARFLDPHVHAHGVAGGESGEGLLQIGGLDTVDGIHFYLSYSGSANVSFFGAPPASSPRPSSSSRRCLSSSAESRTAFSRSVRRSRGARSACWRPQRRTRSSSPDRRPSGTDRPAP